MEVGALAERRYGHQLVPVDKVSRNVLLDSAASCSSEVTVRTIVKCSGLFGVPKALIIDDATHYRDKGLKKVAERSGVACRFP